MSVVCRSQQIPVSSSGAWFTIDLPGFIGRHQTQSAAPGPERRSQSRSGSSHLALQRDLHGPPIQQSQRVLSLVLSLPQIQMQVLQHIYCNKCCKSPGIRHSAMQGRGSCTDQFERLKSSE